MIIDHCWMSNEPYDSPGRPRPALRRFEAANPALAHLDRTKIPSAGGIRRSASDGRPVLGKPGTMDITHRLTPRAGATPDQVQIEVEALLVRAGWQRHDEHGWRRPAPHDHLATVGVHRSHSIDGAPEAVIVRLAPTRQPYRR